MPTKQVDLARLTPVQIKKIWKREDKDFNPWLGQEENLERLGGVLGLELVDPLVHPPVGEFEADILVRDAASGGSERDIVIENQFGKTNHKHLGQLITYAAGINATKIIWLVEHDRNDHRAAIDWLNELTPADVCFFMIKIQVFKIENSPPAPHFELLAYPNNWTKKAKTSAFKLSEELRDRDQNVLEFCHDFVAFANKQDYKPLKGINPAASAAGGQYIGLGSQVYLQVSVAKNHVSTSINIRARSDPDKSVYNQFLQHRAHIEQNAPFELQWRDSDGSASSSIVAKRPGDIENPKDRKPLIEWAYKATKFLREICSELRVGN